MIDRHRPLLAIFAIATIIHLTGMIRSPLPSQDGLKFIRIAREFSHQPWLDVVRSADQHPLYPLLIAASRPAVALVFGDGPSSWRIAAQGVSTLATLAMIPCMFLFSSVLVGRRSAWLAVLLIVLLPTTAGLGHETQSDATALSLAVASLSLGSLALRTGRLSPAVGCGFLAGLGFLARPEVALVPLALAAGWAANHAFSSIRSMLIASRSCARPAIAYSTKPRHSQALATTRRIILHSSSRMSRASGRSTAARQPFAPHVQSPSQKRTLVFAHSTEAEALPMPEPHAADPNLSQSFQKCPSHVLRESKRRRAFVLPILLIGPLLTLMTSYACIKGSISEKISVRFVTGLGHGTGMTRSAPPWLPPGLDDPRWDFSAKEEGHAPGQLALGSAALLTVNQVFEASAWVLLPLAGLGAWRLRGKPRSQPLLLAVGLLTLSFAAILLRHTMKTGYLSDRHCVLIVVAILPLAALGVTSVAGAIADHRAMSKLRGRKMTVVLITSLVVAGFLPHLKPGHPSRWGYAEAGRWIAENASPGEAVLDTRGWAAFASGLRSYGPWHIRQAITDTKLAYVVISDDELSAGTRRAGTLAALLDYAAEPVAAFPEREGGSRIGVRVFRYTRPESWEAILQ